MTVEHANSKDMLVYHQTSLDEKAREYKKQGKLVAWSAALMPTEFFQAMDIALVFPETHSAGIGARKGALDMLDYTTRHGYSLDNCSYARVNLGFMGLLKEYEMTGVKPEALAKSPAADVPLPDLVITSNNICNTLLKWFENLAAELNVPCIVVDAPYIHDMPVPDYEKKYIVKQFDHVIRQLEGITGKAFDHDKFLEAQNQTQRTVKQWQRVASFLNYKPSPLSGFDFFNYMALMVIGRGEEFAEVTLRKFADELEENAKNGKFAFGDNEKSRIAWEGIAVWPYLSHTFKTLKGMGSLMTGSTYPGMWNFEYTPGDMMSMAESYAKIYVNMCLPSRAEELARVCSNGRCEGMLLHMNRSCKIMTLLNIQTADLVQKKLGIPYAAFDGDQTDPGNFAPAQFDTRVQSLCEMMAQKKEV
jgi:benzoyl-CoA reductase/2-hydroxyglutaryl-CoA dehydratase subunit BcrC/BadD/HgdB